MFEASPVRPQQEKENRGTYSIEAWGRGVVSCVVTEVYIVTVRRGLSSRNTSIFSQILQPTFVNF